MPNILRLILIATISCAIAGTAAYVLAGSDPYIFMARGGPIWIGLWVAVFILLAAMAPWRGRRA